MRVLFLTDNFWPERNAPATRTHEHALRWVRDGHQVTVLTTAPNFPDGHLFPGYRNAWFQQEEVDGIRVLRVKSLITANEGVFWRSLDYASFMLSAILVALFLRRPDVLVSTSPQFFCAMAGWVVSRLRRLPWVFELRDLWPASIVAVGAMRRSLAIRVLEWLELRMYRDADAIVSVTRSFKADLVARAVDPGKIVVVPNAADLERFVPQRPCPALLDQFDLSGRFVVGYLGTHGMAHALDKVVDAATLLRDRDDIIFMFAGNGARRAMVENLVRERGLRNVRLVPAQPKESMPDLWSVQDLTLIPLRDDPLFGTVIPSKIFEAMAMGIPVLMSVPQGEATELLSEGGFGVTVRPEDAQAMAEQIAALATDRLRVAELSQAAIRAAAHYSRDHQAQAMLTVMKAVAERRPMAAPRPQKA